MFSLYFAEYEYIMLEIVHTRQTSVNLCIFELQILLIFVKYVD